MPRGQRAARAAAAVPIPAGWTRSSIPSTAAGTIPPPSAPGRNQRVQDRVQREFATGGTLPPPSARAQRAQAREALRSSITTPPPSAPRRSRRAQRRLSRRF